MKLISLLLLLLIIPFAFGSCFDNESGTNFTVAGTVSLSTPNGTVENISDNCVEDLGKHNRLKEVYCDPKGVLGSTYVDCTVLCYKGRCVDEGEKEELFTCYDSDFGKNPSVAGNISGRVNQDSSLGNFRDYCVIGDTNSLMEYYCGADGFVNLDVIECRNGCVDGACVNESGFDMKKCPAGMFSSYYRCYMKDGDEFSLCDKPEDKPDDSACCSLPKDCVIGGKCYNENGLIENGIYAFCRNGYWMDCDGDKDTCTSICGLNWTSIGENHFIGEYDKEIEDCCGDDPGEYFILGEDGSSACCDNDSDVVSGSICYANQEDTTVKKNLTEFRNQLKFLYSSPAENTTSEKNESLDDMETNSSEDLGYTPVSISDNTSSNQTEDLGQDSSEAKEGGFFHRIISFILSIFS